MWNIVHLLLLLSRRPTEAKDDDEPISLPLYRAGSEEAVFDWAAYLKEDLPQYRLPTSEVRCFYIYINSFPPFLMRGTFSIIYQKYKRKNNNLKMVFIISLFTNLLIKI